MNPDLSVLVLTLKLCLAIVMVFGSVITGLVVRVLSVQHRQTVLTAAITRHLGIEVDGYGSVKEVVVGIYGTASAAERRQ